MVYIQKQMETEESQTTAGSLPNTVVARSRPLALREYVRLRVECSRLNWGIAEICVYRSP